MATAGLSLCALLALLYGITRGDWLRGFLAALTMAMAVLPEELPVVLTVFMALGAWRMSRVRVLTRNMPAIEMLGAATVLCVDKTGTLTRNQMEVTRLFAGGESLDVSAATTPAALPEQWHDLLEFAMLSTQVEAHDPMDQAIQGLGERTLSGTEHLHGDWSLVRQYPLARHLLAISQVWRSPDGADYIIAAKGAPEAIADLCHLPEGEVRPCWPTATGLASEGLRVLGVAQSHFSSQDLPGDQHDFTFEFLGLIALADPLRAAVAGCGARVPGGGDPRGDDHGRLCGDGPQHCARRGAGPIGWDHHGAGAERDGCRRRCASGFARLAFLRARCRSRSCAWWRR